MYNFETNFQTLRKHFKVFQISRNLRVRSTPSDLDLKGFRSHYFLFNLLFFFFNFKMFIIKCSFFIDKSKLTKYCLKKYKRFLQVSTSQCLKHPGSCSKLWGNIFYTGTNYYSEYKVVLHVIYKIISIKSLERIYTWKNWLDQMSLFRDNLVLQKL